MLVASSTQYAVYAAAGTVFILVKRVVSNGGPMPDGVPRNTVLMNRLLRDRDIADRRKWLSRAADRTADF